MRKLTKGVCPLILRKNHTDWTNSLLQLKKDGKKPPESLLSNYKLPEIKKSIEDETHGKCLYCEARVKDVSFGDVEHIKPKSVFPEKTFDWDNLSLACEICNRIHKKDHFNPPIINPYIDEPKSHLEASGPMILPKMNDDLGKTTQMVLDLNRTPLFLARKEKIESIHPLLEQWHAEKRPEFRSVIENQLRKLSSEEEEFSFVLEAFLASKGIE